jgi:hypothetical protein
MLLVVDVMQSTILQRMRQYRILAKGLLVFAGMLEYQLPGTALAQLSTTEVCASTIESTDRIQLLG